MVAYAYLAYLLERVHSCIEEGPVQSHFGAVCSAMQVMRYFSEALTSCPEPFRSTAAPETFPGCVDTS